jgi:hypothetical protein
MITPLLHVLRLLPFLFGGYRQLAIENRALRHQLSVYKRTMTRPKLRTTDRLFWVGLARVWAGVEAVPCDRDSRHGPTLAAAPFPRALGQALRPAHRGSPAGQRRHHRPRPKNGRCQSAVGSTTTAPGPTSPSPRTRRTGDRSSGRSWGRSCQSPKSGACTIVTSGEQHSHLARSTSPSPPPRLSSHRLLSPPGGVA